MRRRRTLVVLVMTLAALAAGLTFAFRSSAPGPGASHPLTSSLRVGDLRISLPRGFYSYELRGAFYQPGTRPPVIGHLLTDFPLPAHVSAWKALGHWSSQYGSGPPVHGVALTLRVRDRVPPLTRKVLHVPLTPGQHAWADEKVKDGAIGYRSGHLIFRNGVYDVMYWSGPDAPAADREAIVRALESIRPAR